MKKYNIINNSLGWLCFVIAAVTYALTLEPTASFWDCPEFISQGYKLEVGHPPGNPIFMLAARFFVNFVGGATEYVAVAVNAMSALFSALTILLLFWTITHLVRRLVTRDADTEVPLGKMIVIFASGLCGALTFAWSDTFWFSAVEGEVYAFSSFCTALVFWLILKWENRADEPHSDRYLLLIAYVIGISIAVHLLNLLCIPAIVLVVYYKKYANPTAKGSLLALLVSFVIVALILYGLVPGFIEMSQWFELYFVNTVGLGYNMGVLIYAVILLGCFFWGIYAGRQQTNALAIKASFVICVILSGIPFIGDSLWLPLVLIALLIAALLWLPRIPVRVLNLALLSIFVIFIGYSSYALLLIRSSANPPMNQNEPDNVFALASYLNREQYGETPLLYGRTPNSQQLYRVSGNYYEPITTEGKALYAKVAKESADQPDKYVLKGHNQDATLTPELNMLFPRVYSGQYTSGYKGWIGMPSDAEFGTTVEGTIIVDEDGKTPVRSEMMSKPTFGENLAYFLNYQLNHMYWRYFMWNFAGRQNDIQGNGEVNHGNWITGIPFIDNARLGDQSLLPYEEGEGNKGHNVFFMIPLLLGLAGLLWQALMSSRRGIEQFWVIFFLFFMTGIAIVLYLNQTPGQPRERDYAFAGSFYAYAIWVGIGIAAIARGISALMEGQAASKNPKGPKPEGEPWHRYAMPAAVIAAVIAVLVPLQVVSQTWDDHDRSGRYTARDFGFNYLNSLDDNAIIFTNGDNDTFPLWYAQEVEGVRTDVKVVNLSYLTTDWYANQVKHPSYEAAAIETLAKPTDYAYDALQYSLLGDNMEPTDALVALEELYSSPLDPIYQVKLMQHPNVYIPANLQAAVKAGRVSADDLAMATDTIRTNLALDPYTSRGVTLSNVLSLDILATSARNGWNRPIYFASTVPDDYYMSLTPYMRSTGMAYEVTPVIVPQYKGDRLTTGINADKMYRNVTERFRWGGLDKVKSSKDIYLDETVRRMVSSTRGQLLDLAEELYYQGVEALDSAAKSPDSLRLKARSRDRFDKAVHIMDILHEKLPVAAAPYSVQMGLQAGVLMVELGNQTNSEALTARGIDLLFDELARAARAVVYYQSLTPSQYATLQNTDLYIDRYYFADLLQSYIASGGAPERLEQIPALDKIDYNRIQALSGE